MPMDPNSLNAPVQGGSDLQVGYDHALAGVRACIELDQVGMDLDRIQIDIPSLTDRPEGQGYPSYTEPENQNI